MTVRDSMSSRIDSVRIYDIGLLINRRVPTLSVTTAVQSSSNIFNRILW